MKKLILTAVLAVAALPFIGFAGTVFAVEPYGSIGGGNIVTSKNVTKNGTFADVTNATCSDVIKIRAYVHNPGPNSLAGLRAQALLPSGTATSFSVKMTISATNANPKSESDTTSIKSDKTATLNYVAGSAEYFDAKGARLGSLSDSIVTSGTDVPGGVDVSTLNARYVQFQAKVDCPTPPQPPKEIKVCELSTKKIITIKESDFDKNKHSTNLKDCEEAPKPQPGEITVCELETKKIINIKENEYNSEKHTKDLTKCEDTPETPAPVTPTPEALPKTGIAGLFALASGASGLGFAGHQFYLRRRK